MVNVVDRIADEAVRLSNLGRATLEAEAKDAARQSKLYPGVAIEVLIPSLDSFHLIAIALTAKFTEAERREFWKALREKIIATRLPSSIGRAIDS